MNTINKIKKMFDGLKRNDYIYIGIVIFLLTVIIIMFFIMVNFFSRNINKIFYHDDAIETQGLNVPQYTLVTKKLNINTTNNKTDTNIPPIEQKNQTINTSPIDKQAITIKILNGTNKKGLASVLAKSMSDDGFTILKTGNEKENYATTTLIIQENKIAYTDLIMQALRKSYPLAISTTTNKIDSYDALIIIGNN
jgi:hypothetical protein